MLRQKKLRRECVGFSFHGGFPPEIVEIRFATKLKGCRVTEYEMAEFVCDAEALVPNIVNSV